MYDASGVRLHAGKQASVLNMIITELPPDHPVSDTRPLRDTLGHTPLQVGFKALSTHPSSALSFDRGAAAGHAAAAGHSGAHASPGRIHCCVCSTF